MFKCWEWEDGESWWQIGKNGRTLFDRPRPTVGCNANGRRKKKKKKKKKSVDQNKDRTSYDPWVLQYDHPRRWYTQTQFPFKTPAPMLLGWWDFLLPHSKSYSTHARSSKRVLEMFCLRNVHIILPFLYSHKQSSHTAKKKGGSLTHVCMNFILCFLSTEHVSVIWLLTKETPCIKLIPFRQIKSVCCEIHTKHLNTLCGQILSFVLLDQVVNIVIIGL